MRCSMHKNLFDGVLDQETAKIFYAATAVNAEILNHRGKLGVIAPQAYADLIVVDGNPLKDLSLFTQNGKYIPLVMKNGKIYKDSQNA